MNETATLVRRVTVNNKRYGKLLRENDIILVEEVEGEGLPQLTIVFKEEVREDTAERIYRRISSYLFPAVIHGYDHAYPFNGDYSLSKTWIFVHSSECGGGECPYEAKFMEGE